MENLPNTPISSRQAISVMIDHKNIIKTPNFLLKIHLLRIKQVKRITTELNKRADE